MTRNPTYTTEMEAVAQAKAMGWRVGELSYAAAGKAKAKGIHVIGRQAKHADGEVIVLGWIRLPLGRDGYRWFTIN